MSSTKKSVDEIWKELNASKPKPRQGVAGLAVGQGGVPCITSLVRAKPAAAATTAVAVSKNSPQPDIHAGPYVASAVGEDAAAYLASLQRTINCLADPDRGLRRTAATTLQTKLFTGDASTPRASPAQLQALLCGPLLRPLVAMLADSVERCRTVALAVLLDGSRQLSEVGPMLPELVPELARRFGALPVQEPAEEVRLQIAQLVAQLLAAVPPAQLARFAPDIAAVVCRSLEDGFPEIKKAGCAAIEIATTRLPFSSLEPDAERLVNSLVPNLQHPHSRVRLASIQALDALVAAGAAMVLVEGAVATALRPVGHDRAQPVREANFTALARWMGYPGAAPSAAGGVGGGGDDNSGGAAAAAAAGAVSSEVGSGGAPVPAAQPSARLPSRDYVASLLPLLLIGVSDPQAPTAELALRLVEGVGDVWAAGGGVGGSDGSACGVDVSAGAGGASVAIQELEPSAVPEGPVQSDAPEESTTTESNPEREGDGKASDAVGHTEDPAAAAAVAARVAACRLGLPYHGRPGAGCRAMVRALLRAHLPPLLRQLGEWTSGLRVAAARGLHTTLVLAEEGAAGHLRLLLPGLCSAIADEEVEVATNVMACVHVLGAHVDPVAWLPRMLDMLSPPGAAQAAAQAASTSGGAGERTAAAPSGGGGLSASQRTHMLVVLSGLLHAAGRAQRALPPALLARLAGVLVEEPMLTAAAEHAGVRQQLLAATVNTLAWGGAGCAAVALPLHVVLLQLYGSELVAAAPAAGAAAGSAAAASAPGRGTVGAPALDAMSALAAACGGTGGDDATTAADGAAALAARHSDWLVAALFGDEAAAAAATTALEPSPASPSTNTTAERSDEVATPAAPPPPPAVAWRPHAGDATWQCVLRATMMTASAPTLERLTPGLVSALKPIVGDKEVEAPLRLALLQLLDGVLEDPERGPALAKGGGKALITDVLMPPLVWHAGKTAAAVRYAAVTALATLLGKRLPDPAHVLAAVEADTATAPAAPPPTPSGAAAAAAGGKGGGGDSGLLPLLSSALDEDWYADLRMAACYVAEQLLEVVGPLLSDASRRALYPELHKRLDDAHNSVRVAACGALRAFLAAAGPRYCDTNSSYLVAGVVIHMDDGDQAVQEAAYGVLLAAAATKPSVTAAEIRKVRDRFRSKHYCDRVLAACAAAADAANTAPAPPT